MNFIKREIPLNCELVRQKGLCPYEWVDGLNKLNYKGLPPREAFYSRLKRETITQEEYEYALYVYEKLRCQSFLDYHLIYLKTDVLLLADIFEKFRTTCMKHYSLDPANYISAPGLAWDAMLLKTGIELDLITDLEMLKMVERAKRGGLCFVGSKRMVKANNKYLEDYNPNEDSTFIMYWDANNLYGWAMSQSLPFKNLRFRTDITLEDILSTADDNHEGYFVECDLSFPEELHDKFKEYPPCPENLTPNMEWFSEFQKDLGKSYGAIKNDKYRGSDKLVPHLMEHKKYVLHYRNLKYIKELGVQIDNVHRVISFEQSPWLEVYISFNTEERKKAKDDFEKDFFKLMNNAVFGKTMENVQNRVDMKFTLDEDYAVKYFSKLHFKDSRFINGLYMIEMFKKEIVYDKPCYVGTSILDLSKLCMMEFHYGVIQKDFKENSNLIYSDTDSLVYSIKHPDIYEWIKENREHFDLSDSVRPDMKDTSNKKTLGKFKDEMNTLITKRFIALNPKVYSIIHQHYDDKNVYHENYDKKTLKRCLEGCSQERHHA